MPPVTAPRRGRWARRWIAASASSRPKTSAPWWPICAACLRLRRPICRRHWLRRRRHRPRRDGGMLDPRGKLVFEGACVSCHGWTGESSISPFATLTGAWAVNDPAGTNVAQIVISGTSAPYRRRALDARFRQRLFRCRDRRRRQLRHRAFRHQGIAAHARRMWRSCASRRRSSELTCRRDKTSVRVLAARCARAMHEHCPSKTRGRRESRVRAAPAVSCAIGTRNPHTSIQVQRKQSGLPCAMVLTVSFVLSPVTGFLATVACGN